MLGFLRKHQKIIFAIAGVLVIFSMSFFGITSYGGGNSQKKNVVLGQAIDGSKIHSKEIDEIVRFLSQSSNPYVGLTLTADDVIIKDFLKSGLGAMLIESYYDELKEDLESKLDAYMRYRPYQHPEFPFISAENIWTRFAPDLFNAYHNFFEENDAQKKIHYVIDAYVAQAQFPEDLLRQFLYFHERQFSPRMADPYIQRGNLAVFNVHTPYELFGEKFIALCAQFIHNGALHAKQKGYKVSVEEARASLMDHAVRAHKVLAPDEKTNVKGAPHPYRVALKKLFITEKHAVKIWQKILLFRRLFEEADASVVLDTLAYDQVNKFAQENLDLNVYSLPSSLVVNDFETMMKLEVYLDVVAKRTPSSLVAIPSQYHSVERVKSRCPKLLGKHFKLDIAEVAKSEIALHVGLKELTEYETLCFTELMSKFPELALKPASTIDEKLQVLEQLAPAVKLKIDEYVKEQIIEKNPSWILAALKDKEMASKDVILNLDDVNQVFKGFEDNNDLIEKFERAYADAQKNGEEPVVDLIGDGHAFYRIQISHIDDEYQILTFEQACTYGILDRLLNEKLEREYVNVRMSNPTLFKNASQEFRPLSEVREEVGRLVFFDIIAQLQAYLKTKQGLTLDESISLDELAAYRMYDFFAETLAKRQSSNQDEVSIEGIENQFRLTTKQHTLSRSHPSPLFDECVFRMKKDEWSSIALLPGQGLAFFHVDDKKIDEKEKNKAIDEGYRLLCEEAREVVMKDLLNEMKLQNAIHFAEQEVDPS
ncbi:MAG: SurA N-terminal domain-containing protein [Simkaniaceae bacterium]|nr:SurA N-terminal domain-containing protein [Simkaniaceae bacterium]